MLSRASLLVSFSFASLALSGVLFGAACSSADDSGATGTGSGGGTSSGSGGPIKGPADMHCGTKSQAVSDAACHPTSGTSTSTSTGTGTSTGAGGTTGAGGDVSEYGATLPNAEGDDDDCKYHLSWTATDIRQNTDVTFTAVATAKVGGKPVAAGDVDIEAFLSDTHPAPNSDIKVTESPTGTYKIGPVRFDAAGKWTVRFHLHEDCSDLSEDSPHGHVAFFVNVP